MSLPGLPGLPGLQVNLAPAIEEKESTVHDLVNNTEWRFEVAFGANVEVKLLSGTAELFGTELAINQTYAFNGQKAAIYTWHGCRLEVTGICQIDYIAEETPMVSYANTHFALEDLRIDSIAENSLGPRIMVIGPENAGKTSLVKLLAAYATRAGRQPIVVNLDPKEGMLSVPGTLSAFALESILDVEEGWGSSPTNGPSQIPVKLPLVYYYGLEDPETQPELYKPLITRLALSVLNRMEDDGDVKHSGCIIDTSGSMSQGKNSYDLIQHCISEFNVNIVLVLGSERLTNDMTRRFQKPASSTATPTTPPITVLKLDKSGGCVDRDAAYQIALRDAQVRAYFFGTARHALSPHTQLIEYADVRIFTTPEPTLPSSLLPGDHDTTTPPPTPPLISLTPASLITPTLLALTSAVPDDVPANIRDASILGFLYVVEVEEKKGRLRVLAPLSGRVPGVAMRWSGGEVGELGN